MLSLMGQAMTCASIFKEKFSASQNKPGALAFFGSKRAGAIQREPVSVSARQFRLKATIKTGVQMERMSDNHFTRIFLTPFLVIWRQGTQNGRFVVYHRNCLTKALPCWNWRAN